jgi:hypothetical protein
MRISKAIIALLLSIFLIGAVSAVPPISGGAQGIHVRNLWVDGNIVTAGTMTAATNTTTGNIGADQTWAANKDIKFAAGTGEIDLSASTSTTKTTTGDNTVGGDLYMASGKDIRGVGGNSLFDMSMCSGAFLTPTGAVTIGPGATALTGATTITDLAAITAGSGSAAYDLHSSTGAFLTPTGAITIGSGAIAMTGTVTMASGKDIIGGASTSDLDFSASGGVFKSPTGQTTLNGPVGVAAGVDIVAAGAGSDIDYALSTNGIFKTPGGAVTIGPGAIGVSGTATVATGKSIIVTDADKLTVGGTIIPQIIPIKYTFDQNSVNRSITILDGHYQIVEIDEVHSVVGGTGAKLYILKCNGTEVPNLGSTGGYECTAAAIDLTSGAAVNTVQTPALNTTNAYNYKFLGTHDRIVVAVAGTLTGVIGEVTVWIKRVT